MWNVEVHVSMMLMTAADLLNPNGIVAELEKVGARITSMEQSAQNRWTVVAQTLNHATEKAAGASFDELRSVCGPATFAGGGIFNQDQL